MEPAAYVFVFGLILAVTVIAMYACTRGGDEEPGEGGGGQSAPRSPGAPKRPGSPGEPFWWPQFEREFAEYAARAPTRRIAPDAPPPSAVPPKP